MVLGPGKSPGGGHSTTQSPTPNVRGAVDSLRSRTLSAPGPGSHRNSSCVTVSSRRPSSHQENSSCPRTTARGVETL